MLGVLKRPKSCQDVALRVTKGKVEEARCRFIPRGDCLQMTVTCSQSSIDTTQ